MPDIYNYYVAHSIVTFGEEPVPAEELARRISAVQTAGLPWLVADDDGQIIGYASRLRDISVGQLSAA